MATTIDSIFKLKRGTTQRWNEVNPILNEGEPGFATDINQIKIGDGIHTWNELQYIESDITSKLADYALKSEIQPMMEEIISNILKEEY